MKKILCFLTIILSLASATALVSCDDDDTYAEQKERERDAINAFLRTGVCVLDPESNDTVLHVPPITVISEEQFYRQDSTTDLSRNEYVLIDKAGVYMQIVEKGEGKKLEHGETARVLCRYIEYNIMSDSVMTGNDNLYYVAVPDIMTVSNNYGVFTASFISGVMQVFYSSAAVPNGWTIPFAYVGLRRIPDEKVAKVRLIVPHDSGTVQAQSSMGIYPCFYELTLQRGNS